MSDDGSGSDAGDNMPGRPEGRRGGGEREHGQRAINLADILRVLAGDRLVHERATAGNNEELVAELKRRGTITNDLVYRAMLACPRGLFVPTPQQRHAYVDAPIRVEDMGFNISAPHIHATALETLDLASGDSFLDVGSGSGFVAAAAAYMVGTSGSVISVDVRPAAIRLSRASLRQLKATNTEYEAVACPIAFQLHNIFYPHRDFHNRFDKIYIGAACPSDRLAGLVKMLRAGGKMLVPVDSQLLLVTKRADGSVRREVTSSVSFSELEVPSDSEVVLAILKEEQEKQGQVHVPHSTLEQDLRTAAEAATTAGPGAGEAREGAATRPVDMAETLDTTVVLAPVLHNGGASGGGGHGGNGGARNAAERGDSDMQRDMKRHKSGGCMADYAYLQSASAAALGPPDCRLLAGVDQQCALPAHRALLTARCDHLRALFESGMRDARQHDISTPESFTCNALKALLAWVYTDELQLDSQGRYVDKVAELLHVACYYGCARLGALCEAALAGVLQQHHQRHKESCAKHGRAEGQGRAKEAAGGAKKAAGQAEGSAGQTERAGPGTGLEVPARPSIGSTNKTNGSVEGWDSVNKGNAACSVAAMAVSPAADGQASAVPEMAAKGNAEAGAGAAAGADAATTSAGTSSEPGEVAMAEGEGCHELALQLLVLARDNGLEQLRGVALSYIANDFEAHAATEAWRQLPRDALDHVTRYLATRHAHLLALVHEVAQGHGDLSLGSVGSTALHCALSEQGDSDDGDGDGVGVVMV